MRWLVFTLPISLVCLGSAGPDAAGQSAQSYEAGIVRGRVILGDNRQPAPANTLVVANGRGGSLKAATDSDGQFELRGLGPGTWYVRAYLRGYCQREDGVVNIGGQRINYIKPDPISLTPCEGRTSGSAPAATLTPRDPLAAVTASKTAQRPAAESFRVVSSERNQLFEISQDGTLAATASGNVVRVRSTKDLKEIAALQHRGNVTMGAFSPHGTYLATAVEDGSAALWQVRDGRQIAEMRHAAHVTALAFSPDERLLATADRDNILQVWDVGGHLLVSGQIGPVQSIAFAPDGRSLFVSGDGRTQLLRW